jgi:flagellar basal body-associated protein FliL
MLQKILKIVNAVSQVILIITALISLFTAYIVFAPEQLPKPFHLVYSDPTTVQAASLEPASVAQPTAVPTARTYLPGEGVMVNMSSKIINLVDPTGRKYIRITVVVEFAPDNPEYDAMPAEEKTTYLTEFTDKLNSKMPIMDDTVVTLLSTKTYDDLYTADGKEKLRSEIMNDLTQKLPDLHIISIYFTEFVVQ